MGKSGAPPSSGVAGTDRSGKGEAVHTRRGRCRASPGKIITRCPRNEGQGRRGEDLISRNFPYKLFWCISHPSSSVARGPFFWGAGCWQPRFPRRAPGARRIFPCASGRWRMDCPKTRLRRWCRRTTAICGWAPTAAWPGLTGCASPSSTIRTRLNCPAGGSRACLSPATKPSGLALKTAGWRCSKPANSRR